MAKAAVGGAEGPLQQGMLAEAHLFQQSIRTEGAQRNMRRFMDRGGQTPAVELRVGAAAGELPLEDK